MGNCIRHESSVQWAGDDWSLPDDECHKNDDHEALLGDTDHIYGSASCCSSRSATTTTTEVKIKITKKQLEELLGKVDLKELSVQQVLAQLMNVSDRFETNQRSWRPALQSIPEVN